MEFAEEGGEGATPYEVLLHAAMVGDSKRFTRQDSVEQAWRVMQPLLDSPPPVHAYAQGSWGPRRGGRARRRARQAGTARGWRLMTHRQGRPSRRAPRRPRRSRRSPTTRSCPTAIRAPSSRPTARSTGSACRASTRRACSARCSTARPARFRLGPVRHQRADGPHLRARDEHRRHDVEDADRLDPGARRADDGPEPRRGRDHAAHPAAGRRRRATTCWCARSSASRASVEVELVCEPDFDYGRTPADVVAGRRRPPHGGRDRRRPDDQAAEPTWRSASRATGCGPATRSSRASRPTARSPGPRSSPSPQDVDEANARLAATTRYWRALARAARACPTTAGATRSSARRSRSRASPTCRPAPRWRRPTTSLPETPGGERNWDYRFTWIRDSTFTLQALHFLNLDWEADEFMQFVADLEPNDDGALQIMYGIDGRRDLTESTPRRAVRVRGGAARCGSATAPSTSARTTSSARRSTRSCCTRAAASACRGGCGRSSRAQARVRHRGLARARPGHLGGPRRARSTTSRRS